jgi:hypothetical protein
MAADGAQAPVLAETEHRDLTTELHDLGVLGCLAAAQQHQPAEDPDDDQVEQAVAE